MALRGPHTALLDTGNGGGPPWSRSVWLRSRKDLGFVNTDSDVPSEASARKRVVRGVVGATDTNWSVAMSYEVRAGESTSALHKTKPSMVNAKSLPKPLQCGTECMGDFRVWH